MGKLKKGQGAIPSPASLFVIGGLYQFEETACLFAALEQGFGLIVEF
jgi:hypothetical protein